MPKQKDGIQLALKEFKPLVGDFKANRMKIEDLLYAMGEIANKYASSTEHFMIIRAAMLCEIDDDIPK